MKKAGAEMWWIIIGAVIALVVMIILMVMFTDKTGGVSRGLLDCESKGGTCTNSNAEQCKTAGGTPSGTFSCSESSNPSGYCCFPK
ncbi:hypothetical protein HYX12_00090 [Candidatus Woesearchaeota archaeon]|nr:hypothetical protein [Candidatus Woesearchaeota archaeon]